MVEKRRELQVAGLREKGWREDEECKRLSLGHRNVQNGPTFMRSPDGRMHAITAGRERPLDGGYRRWMIDLPRPGDDIPRLEGRNGTVRGVEYANGRPVA